MRKARSILTSLGLIAAMTGPVLAHSKSQLTEPADGATVADVPEITLSFEAPMRVISVALSQDGTKVALERDTGMDPVTEFTARPAEPLPEGAYLVEWRGMSADGHPMQGGFTFTVAR